MLQYGQKKTKNAENHLLYVYQKFYKKKLSVF